MAAELGVLAGCRLHEKARGFAGYAFIANQDGRAIAAVDLEVFAVARHIRLDGAPTAVLFKGDFQQKLTALNVKYANVPLDNYATFIDSSHALRSEPRRQTQKLYAAIDPVMQAVLTDAGADPQALLAKAAQQFQQVLDSSAA